MNSLEAAGGPPSTRSTAVRSELSNDAAKEVMWDKVVAALHPSWFEDVLRRDAATVKSELERLGMLDVVRSGRISEEEWAGLLGHPQEELRLFMASQIATQYLQKSLTAIRTREHELDTALRNVEKKISETHMLYEKIRAERSRVAVETRRVSEEIAECDRILKTTSSPAKTTSPRASQSSVLHLALDAQETESPRGGKLSEEEDSPWEDAQVPRTMADHHIRSSLIFSIASSPFGRSSQFQSGLLSEPASPRYARSRASSGTSGADDDDLVLFASNSTHGWFYDRNKDTVTMKVPLEGITEGSRDNIDGEGDVEEENDEFF